MNRFLQKLYHYFSQPFMIGTTFSTNFEYWGLCTYDNLYFWQRIFIITEYPNSCLLAQFYSLLNTFSIILSILVSALETVPMPAYQTTPTSCAQPACDNDPTLCPGAIICEPKSVNSLILINVVCIGFFSIDYILRLSLCASVPAMLARLNYKSTDTFDEITSPHKPLDIRESTRGSFIHRESIGQFLPTLPLSSFSLSTKAVQTQPTKKKQLNPYGFYPWYYQMLQYMLIWSCVIDVIAIVPYWIQLLDKRLSSFSFVRVLLLFRLMRIFKLTGKSNSLSTITLTLKRSKNALSLMIFSLCILVVFFGSLLFLIEQGDFIVNEDYPQGAYLVHNPVTRVYQPSQFTSIPAAIYWAVITVTTVGYGDLTAVTFAGRTVSCLCAIVGVLTLALPISVIGSNFGEVHNEYTEKKAKRRAKERLARSQSLIRQHSSRFSSSTLLEANQQQSQQQGNKSSVVNSSQTGESSWGISGSNSEKPSKPIREPILSSRLSIIRPSMQDLSSSRPHNDSTKFGPDGVELKSGGSGSFSSPSTHESGESSNPLLSPLNHSPQSTPLHSESPSSFSSMTSPTIPSSLDPFNLPIPYSPPKEFDPELKLIVQTCYPLSTSHQLRALMLLDRALINKDILMNLLSRSKNDDDFESKMSLSGIPPSLSCIIWTNLNLNDTNGRDEDEDENDQNGEESEN